MFIIVVVIVVIIIVIILLYLARQRLSGRVASMKICSKVICNYLPLELLKNIFCKVLMF